MTTNQVYYIDLEFALNLLSRHVLTVLLHKNVAISLRCIEWPWLKEGSGKLNLEETVKVSKKNVNGNVNHKERISLLYILGVVSQAYKSHRYFCGGG